MKLLVMKSIVVLLNKSIIISKHFENKKRRTSPSFFVCCVCVLHVNLFSLLVESGVQLLFHVRRVLGRLVFLQREQSLEPVFLFALGILKRGQVCVSSYQE
jgi:hypothetical protein